MTDKIEKALDYYSVKSKEIVEHVNSNNELTAEQIIQSAEELAILEYKLTALEVAKAS
tara:strand:- start:1502 stop:1675 length:174 start_codon:yes stop_codon:yes gene_type:complete